MRQLVVDLANNSSKVVASIRHNASSLVGRYNITSTISKSILEHQNSVHLNGTSVSTGAQESMSDSTKWIITASILVASSLLFLFLRTLKVHADDTLLEDKNSGSPTERRLSPEGISRVRSPDRTHVDRAHSDRSADEAGSSEVVFISFGRIKDHQIIASHCPGEGKEHGSEKDFEEDATNLLKLAKRKNFKAGSRDKLDNKKRSCRIFYSMDESKCEFMAIVMVQAKYTESAAYGHLYNLQNVARKHADEARVCQKGGLNISLTGTMEEMCTHPSPRSPRVPGRSSQAPPSPRCSARPSQAPATGALLEKMAAINDSIRHNVAVAQENDSSLRSLQGHTKRMDNAAAAFKEDSRLAGWKHALERYKCGAYVGIVLVDCISIWIVWSV